MKGRSIAAVFGGIIAGAIIAYFLSPLIDTLYPTDLKSIKAFGDDFEGIKEYFRNYPAGFHLFTIGVGVVRLTVGLIVGSLIDRTNLMTLLVIGMFSLLLAVLEVFAFPHPVWFGFVYIPAMLGITFLFVYAKRKA
ncbi:MAG: hypothetical protein Crog4KO_17620 [Crocinitomicaceae bacterium]